MFDYHNQMVLSKNGNLHEHLNGKDTVLKESGKPIPAFTTQEFTVEDYLKFLKQLDYYQNHPKDVIRRFNNIEEYFKDKKEEQEANIELENKLPKESIEKEPNEIKEKVIKTYSAHETQKILEIMKNFVECIRQKYPNEVNNVMKLGYALAPIEGSEENLQKIVLPYPLCADILVQEIRPAEAHDEL